MGEVKPEDLYSRLKTHAINSKQRYDYFISHSSKDKKRVREVISKLNLEGSICYCDWSIDDIFLKRENVNDYTRDVLKVRMQQSNKLLLVRTKNSAESEWVEFELNYFEQLGKPIYEINHIDNVTAVYPILEIHQ